MCFGTLRQWRCYKAASIPRPSRYGLGTNHLQPLTSTWDANLALKEQILDKIGTWDGTKTGRYRPEDPVLKFLKSL